MSAVTEASHGFGASAQEWAHFSRALGLTEDLLPLVSNKAIPISERSSITDSSRSKTPSEFRNGTLGGFRDWANKRSTLEDVAKWAQHPDHNICILTRSVRAIDIDIEDPATVDSVLTMIELTFGTLPKRMRAGSSRCLLAFRMPGDFRHLEFDAPSGAIEFLAGGQQFVAVGTHKSGARYEWEGGLPTEIPELSPEDFKALWDSLASVCAAPGVRAPRADKAVGVASSGAGGDADVSRANTLALVTRRVVDEIRSAMTVFTAEDADRYKGPGGWFSVGNALKSLTQAGARPGEFSEDALEMWHTFSAKSAKYVFDDAQRKWDEDLKPTLGTHKSIFTWAQEDGRGWKNPRSGAALLESEAERAERTDRERQRSARIGRDGVEERQVPVQRVMSGSEMLEELVYLADGSRVSFLGEPRFVLPLSEFKYFTAGSVTKVPDTKRTAHQVDLWMRSPERKGVRTQTFAPGKGSICDSPEGDTALNLWRPRRDAVPINWEALAAPFFEHVEYLVPNAAERGRFLDWLAHIEQSPGVLPHTHYLLVAKQTGIGRNWLAYALARCFAGYTALGYNLAESLRTGFNGELSQRLLAVVDELHEGGPGGATRSGAEKLKSLLTESTRRINPKYGRQHTEFNACRFLMFSNHEAALPLAENDRRVIVIENPGTRRSEDRYAQLYGLLDTPGFGPALAEALKRRDIRGFNPGSVAPMNAAKGRTIRAGRSEIEAAVRDIAAEWPSDCITSSRLQQTVAEALGGRSWTVQGACVAAGLVKFRGRVKVSGSAAHVWILRGASEWEAAAPLDVAAEVKRGEALLYDELE